MMPQTVTVTFMLVWLIRNDGWSIAAAGGVMTVSQLLGALGRILVGRWSDRIGSRMRPVALIAAAAASTLFLLAYADHRGSRAEVALMIAVSVIAVLDNGLEATAITEFAGPFWSGRALGIQNTTQRLMAAAGPPLFGALISAAKYPPAWALCGLVPAGGGARSGARDAEHGATCSPAARSRSPLERGGNPFADFAGGKPFVRPCRQIGSRRHGPPGQPRHPRRGGQAAAPPT